MRRLLQPMAILGRALRAWHVCWRDLVLVAGIFQLLVFSLVAPATALVLEVLIRLSGEHVRADVDIATFLVSPLGLIALLLAVGIPQSAFALRQACMFPIGLGAIRGVAVDGIDSSRYALARIGSVVAMVLRIAARFLLTMAPFVAISAIPYLLLLTEHDINYYLAERPPESLLAAGLILVILGGGVAWGLRTVIQAAHALPFVLFENVSSKEAVARSRRLASGHLHVLLVLLGSWILVSFAVRWIPVTVAAFVGRRLLPGLAGTGWFLPGLSGVLMLWGLLSLGAAVFNGGLYVLLRAGTYEALGGGDRIPIPAELRTRGEAGRHIKLNARVVVTATVLLAIAATLFGYSFINSLPRNEERVVVVAHRGAAGAAPENTLAAIALALEQGADYVEVDVQEAADGEVMVIHDRDLMRVGRTDLQVWRSRSSDLRRVDVGGWFATEFQGERIPTLEEVLELCRDRARVIIELKYHGHNDRLEARVVEIVERLGMQDQIATMSLEEEMVATMKALRPEWTTGLLAAGAIGDLAKSDADFLAISPAVATRAFIRHAHDEGKRVYVWTVNEPVKMSLYVSRGADGLITDYPALAGRFLDRWAEITNAERLLLVAAHWIGLTPKRVEEEFASADERR